ncbi:MAG TPA: hypothetical protein VLG48_12715 [Candidatus Methylomirabilis sp.]|nr:hypothetical protein [Candidatus Methylomirabilis sp.]
MWRYTLIVGYMILGLGGIWIAMFTRFRLVGYGLFAASLVCFGINSLLSRRDERSETKARADWIASIKAVADDLSLEGYPISDLLELADYHDAPGRAAVLASLRALPAGSRSLLTAARIVDPDPYLD